eukprot:5189971-Pyramimonas_sp.AAC.1
MALLQLPRGGADTRRHDPRVVLVEAVTHQARGRRRGLDPLPLRHRRPPPAGNPRRGGGP